MVYPRVMQKIAQSGDSGKALVRRPILAIEAGIDNAKQKKIVNNERKNIIIII